MSSSSCMVSCSPSHINFVVTLSGTTALVFSKSASRSNLPRIIGGWRYFLCLIHVLIFLEFSSIKYLYGFCTYVFRKSICSSKTLMCLFHIFFPSSKHNICSNFRQACSPVLVRLPSYYFSLSSLNLSSLRKTKNYLRPEMSRVDLLF